MNKFLSPLETKPVEQDGEHLEVVVLLVAHDIYHLVNGEIGETHLGGAYILGHVNAGSVGTEQQFLVETFVCEVGPD